MLPLHQEGFVIAARAYHAPAVEVGPGLEPGSRELQSLDFAACPSDRAATSSAN